MGVFNSIFGKSENLSEADNKVNWMNLEYIEQLNTIVQKSNEKPIIIFKHSTRCGISRMVLKQFEKEYNLENRVEAYLLDLLNYRDISSAIATQFGVNHQSPQILLIKDGSAVYHASHHDINAGEVVDKVDFK